MSEVIYLDPSKRPSKADEAFSPILAQQRIDAVVAAEQRRETCRKYTTYFRHAVVWGVIWTITLGLLGLATA